MWPHASGDFTVPIPGGISGIIIALILAGAIVTVAALRRRRSDPSEAVDAATDAASNAVVKAFVTRIAELEARVGRLRDAVEQRETLLDEAYQQGFRPERRPSPTPRAVGGSDDE